MLLKLVVLAAVAAVARGTWLECKDTYTQAYAMASMPTAKCAAVRQLAQCIADLNLAAEDPLKSEIEAYRDVVIFHNQDCAELDADRVPMAPRATSLDDVLTFTVDQGKDIRFTRRAAVQKTTVFELSEKLAELAGKVEGAATKESKSESSNAVLDGMRAALAQVGTTMGTEAAAKATEAKNAIAGFQRSSATSFGTSVSGYTTTLTARASDLERRVSTADTTVRNNLNTVMTNEANARVALVTNVNSALTTENTDRLNADNALRAAANTLATSVQTAIDSMTTTLNGRVSTAQSTMTLTSATVSAQTPAINARQPLQRQIWSGYCQWMGSSGWSEYCNTAVEFGYLEDNGFIRRSSATRFVALRTGYYRIHWWTISLSSSYAHTNLYIAGAVRWYGYEYGFGAWTDNFVDTIWRIDAGQEFFLQSYGTSYAYHNGNPVGVHSRLQIEYVGSL